MGAYRCFVVDKSGTRKELIRTGASEEEVAATFSTGEWFLISLKAAGRGRHDIRYPSPTILEFTEMTSLLLESGLTLRDALEVELEFPAEPKFLSLVGDLIEDIRKGSSLADAVERRGTSFPPLYRGMIRIGDRIGAVDKVFPRIARYLGDRKTLRDRLVGAAMYPVLVLFFAVFGTMIVSFFLLPRVADLFSQLGGPAATDIRARTLYAATLFRGMTVFLSICVFGLFLILRLRGREGRAALAIDKFLLSNPLSGSFVRASETLNFSMAMEILATGSIPLESALAEAATVCGNRAYREAVSGLRDAVLRGESLSAACAGRNEFPPYVARWIAVGENSGNPERVFGQIRRYFQSDLEKRSSRLMTLIEPALIVVVGIIVLFLVLTFVLPLFSIYESIL